MYCLRKQDPDIFGIKEFKIKIVVKHSFFFFSLFFIEQVYNFHLKRRNRIDIMIRKKENFKY